jgi:hypothetical protein
LSRGNVRHQHRPQREHRNDHQRAHSVRSLLNSLNAYRRQTVPRPTSRERVVGLSDYNRCR